jgi:hypothetical protein
LPRAFAALEAGKEAILADESTKGIKQSLSSERAYYLDSPPIA